MLNNNKIDSLINNANLKVTDVAKIVNQPYTTIVNRKAKGTWTPNDIEKLADYFQKSILYFFDRENELPKAETENIKTAPESPVERCDNPACLKRISELEDDKNLLKEYNKLLKAQLARGGLDEGKSSEGGLEESPTGS